VSLPEGFVNPFDEFSQRYGDNWPLLVREVFGADPDVFQEEILLAVQTGERRLSVVSGHGVGKTTVLAWCCCCMLLTRFPQKTVCTAPTSGQLFNALYAEVVKWLTKLPDVMLSFIEIQSERIYHRAAPQESYVAFETSRPEKPEALAGVHSDGYVLLIGDEASGIHEIIFEAASGSMSGHNATTLLAGNPVRTSGLFYDTHHKLRDTWRTIQISCVDHPRVAQDFVEDMARRYGVNSNQYRVRVLGEFPLGDDDTIIPRALAEAALVRDVQAIEVRPIWGLDPAWKGKDVTALCVRVGNYQKGEIETRAGYNTMQTAGWIKSRYDGCNEGDRPSIIVIDVIGIGAGVVDRLEEQGVPVLGVNVSEGDLLSNPDKYLNLRAELWWKGLAWLEKRNCKLDDPELVEELVTVKKDHSSTGKLKAEGKKEMRKRGVKSPNRADAFLLTLAEEAESTAATFSGASKRTTFGTKRTDWKKPLTRGRSLMG
jgi:hypothetical protein